MEAAAPEDLGGDQSGMDPGDLADALDVPGEKIHILDSRRFGWLGTITLSLKPDELKYILEVWRVASEDSMRFFCSSFTLQGPFCCFKF